MTRHEVVTPVPGVFYRRSDPTSAPFKSDGDEVQDGETIAVVEIMKNFQAVDSDAAGRLVEFLVENEDAVSAGQPVAVIEVDG
ncbi:MAG: acetyl-CoA carboxylase biotin carboxyl carrier protein [bacterium]|jgi:biotin carboxyl carrier protein